MSNATLFPPTPVPLPEGESILTALRHLQGVRYATVAAFTAFIYDIFLTLEVERVVVWSQKRMGIPRIIYVITRYGGLGLFIFFLAFLMPVAHHSNIWCRNAAAAIIAADSAIETLGNGIILYELIYLWGTTGIVAWLMASGFIILHSATVVSVIVGLVQIKNSFHFIDFGGVIRVCSATFTPSAFKGIYIPAVALDIYSFALLFLNVLSRPRATSQNLMDLLLGDGLVFFLTTLSMRTMCLFINILAPPDLGILGLMVGSMIVILAICRLFLRLNNSQPPYALYDNAGVFCAEEVLLNDGTELQFRRSM